MNGNFEILLPILFPIILGGYLAADKRLNKTRALRIITTAALVLNFAFVVLCIFREGKELFLWNLSAGLRINFRVDNTGRFFSALVAAMFTLVGFFSFEYIKHEDKENQFLGFYLITYGTLIGIDFAGNLITMYLFFELMTVLSLPLVVHSRTKESIAAGIKYLIYSLFGAFMGLLGIFFLSRYTISMEFVTGGILNAYMIEGNETLLRVLALLMIMGFGTKAGMFPLHGWLPTAHPVAPAPASAILSGVITKAGVIAIIRVVFYIYGADFIRGTWVQYTWLALAVTTVVMGSMMAYKEKVFKKRLAYSTVSQVSYILFGLATLTDVGFTGAMLHVVFHSVIKNTLFLVAGAVIYKTHITEVDGLRGMGKRMPVTMWMFTIASLALVGIPPLSGFVSKWYLATGSIDSGVALFSWFGPAALLVSAVLTAGYLISISINSFLPGKDFEAGEKCEPNLLMTLPMAAMTLMTVLFGIMPNGMVEFVQSIVSVIFKG